MPRCIRCAIDGDDVTMHNGAWVHRAPGICFKKLRDVVESLQQERTGLRAELDAIKGAQVPFAYGGNNADGFPVISLSAQAGLPPLYRHPAPALPVVGACVVKPNGETIAFTYGSRRQHSAIAFAEEMSGKAYPLYRGVDELGAPLPTEGGK